MAQLEHLNRESITLDEQSSRFWIFHFFVRISSGTVPNRIHHILRKRFFTSNLSIRLLAGLTSSVHIHPSNKTRPSVPILNRDNYKTKQKSDKKKTINLHLGSCNQRFNSTARMIFTQINKQEIRTNS